MARSEIADKLSDLLPVSEWSEPLVVYFFVQARKLLDHRESVEEDTYPNLRFFCDWVVHISKDRIDDSTVDILKNLQIGIEKQIKSPQAEASKDPINFAYFEHLKPEVIALMKEEGIPTVSLEGSDEWIELISNLVKVLENQPLVVNSRHGLNISEVVFRPSNPRCVILLVKFVKPVEGTDGKDLHYFRLMNAY
jgi:hypothetical protein